MMHLVGEKGPELFTPGRSGVIHTAERTVTLLDSLTPGSAAPAGSIKAKLISAPSAGRDGQFMPSCGGADGSAAGGQMVRVVKSAPRPLPPISVTVYVTQPKASPQQIGGAVGQSIQTAPEGVYSCRRALPPLRLRPWLGRQRSRPIALTA